MQEPSLSLLRPPQVTELIRKCQTGCVKNLTRYNLQFFRKLIEADEFYFRLVYSHIQRGKFFQRFDKLFVHNGRHVYNLRSDRINDSTRLYSIEQYVRGLKLADHRVLAIKSPIYTPTMLPRSKYRPMLLILNDHNKLLVIDFDTGELIDTIYLGSMERCKFTYIGWEKYMETILIQSTDLMAQTDGRVISYNILMSIWPLKFIACFDIECHIFERQRSTNISEGMLILSNPQPPDQFVNIYSLTDILDPENYKWYTDIDKHCTNEERCDECWRSEARVVGRDGHGFPTNIIIKTKPRLLLSILTCFPCIEFGYNPFHFIYSPPGQRDTFNVERLEGRVPVINGSITFDNYLEEHNKLLFHDDPVENRIISIESHKLAFYKIINNVLTRRGELSPTPPEFFDDLQVRMRNQRKAKKNDNMYKSFFSHVYDVDTEIFFVLGVDLSSDKPTTPVMCLFDNFNGQLLKKFPLNFKAEESNDYDLWADRDLLFINENNSFGPSRAMCYRLERLPIEI